MEIDLDDTLSNLLEWDFSIRVKGVLYPTKPIEVGDVAVLQKAITRADGDVGGLIEAVANLFAGTRPPIQKWPTAYLLGTISAVIEYWRGIVSKNSKAIASQVAGAMARASTPGGSTQGA